MSCHQLSLKDQEDLALIASVTDRELARYVEFLKEENKILRNRVTGQIHTKPHERERLLKLGKPLGRTIDELLAIVSPSTFYRWLRDAGQGSKRTKPLSSGRRKPKEIRELVIQIAKSTPFGYTRILGELRKLGMKKVSRQTVRNILNEEGIQPGPNRTSDSWQNFIDRHAKALWAVDFFSVRTTCLCTRSLVVVARASKTGDLGNCFNSHQVMLYRVGMRVNFSLEKLFPP